jgi:large subunit ribosomal protein L21
MRYAVVESGGKQYRAVEGEIIEVDRLSNEAGTQIDLQRVLFMADGSDVLVGTPAVSDLEVRATVVDHISGRKVIHFRYSPKKRIRVKGGHRPQYTRLLVDFIGRKGETRKVEKVEKVPRPEEVAVSAPAGVAAKSAKQTATAAAGKSAPKTPSKKPSAGGKAAGSRVAKKSTK